MRISSRNWIVIAAAIAAIIALTVWYFYFKENGEGGNGNTAMGASATYEIELSLNERDEFQIRTVIEVANETERPFEDIGFYFVPNALNSDETPDLPQEAAETAISSIKVGDEEGKYELENNELLVELAEPLEPGEKETIQVVYSLALPENGIRLSQDGNNFFLAQWYPMLAQFDNGWDIEPFDMDGESYHTGFGDFRIDYQLPREYLVASSATDGEVKPSVSGTLEGDRIKDFYLALMVPEEWIHETVSVEGAELRLFMPDDPELLEESAVMAEAAYLFFEERIGDNPFPELDIIGNDGYMEYPNIIEVATTWEALDSVLVHEIAHQWFYYIVGNDPFEDAWVDESITEFAASLFLSDYYGDEEYGFSSAEAAANAYRQEKYANLPLDEFVGAQYLSTVYGAAPLKLRNFFEERGGQEEALQFLSAYYREFQFEYVNTDKFKQFFEAYFEGDQSGFLDNWLE